MGYESETLADDVGDQGKTTSFGPMSNNLNRTRPLLRSSGRLGSDVYNQIVNETREKDMNVSKPNLDSNIFTNTGNAAESVVNMLRYSNLDGIEEFRITHSLDHDTSDHSHTDLIVSPNGNSKSILSSNCDISTQKNSLRKNCDTRNKALFNPTQINTAQIPLDGKVTGTKKSAKDRIQILQNFRNQIQEIQDMQHKNEKDSCSRSTDSSTFDKHSLDLSNYSLSTSSLPDHIMGLERLSEIECAVSAFKIDAEPYVAQTSHESHEENSRLFDAKSPSDSPNRSNGTCSGRNQSSPLLTDARIFSPPRMYRNSNMNERSPFISDQNNNTVNIDSTCGKSNKKNIDTDYSTNSIQVRGIVRSPKIVQYPFIDRILPESEYRTEQATILGKPSELIVDSKLCVSEKKVMVHKSVDGSSSDLPSIATPSPPLHDPSLNRLKSHMNEHYLQQEKVEKNEEMFSTLMDYAAKIEDDRLLNILAKFKNKNEWNNENIHVNLDPLHRKEDSTREPETKGKPDNIALSPPRMINFERHFNLAKGNIIERYKAEFQECPSNPDTKTAVLSSALHKSGNIPNKTVRWRNGNDLEHVQIFEDDISLYTSFSASKDMPRLSEITGCGGISPFLDFYNDTGDDQSDSSQSNTDESSQSHTDDSLQSDDNCDEENVKTDEEEPGFVVCQSNMLGKWSNFY